MTQTIEAALSELKPVLSQMAPLGEPPLAGVWIYPDEYELLSLDTLPVVLISEAINVRVVVAREAQRRTLMHKWEAQVQIMLAEGKLTDDRSVAAVAQHHRKWIAELVRVIVSNSTLNNKVVGLGVKIPGEVLTYQVGQIPWWNSRTFWGISAIVDVYQMMRFETKA